MLSVILSFGPVTLYSLGFLMAIGAFLLSFIIWRRLKDLGLKEEKVLDFIIISLLLGFLFARLFFLVEHFDKFGFSFSRLAFICSLSWFLFLGLDIRIFSSLRWFAKKKNGIFLE